MSFPSNAPYTPDLRGFIEFLEKEHPGQVVRIKKEVDPKFGVSGIIERLERDGKFPLVIFENVKGSKIPLVANMHASFERLRLGLGMEQGDVKAFVKECAARQAHPIDPVMVDKAPVQEEMFIGDQVSVEDLPICTYHEKDAGKYITKLPKADHTAAEWQAALEALILVATSGGQRCLRASAFVGGRPAGANDASFRRIHCNGRRLGKPAGRYA